MKKLIVAMAASAVVLGGASLALANGSGVGILGSPHDFTDNLNKGKSVAVDEVSATGWNYRAEVCRVCHAPHDKGRTNYTNGLLWNHLASSAAYTMYDSPTLDGVKDAGPGGSSKLCLSCHDGSVALDTFDSHAGATPTGTDFIGTEYANSSLPVATNLNGTHPISITYNNAVDTGLKDPAVATMADGVAVAKYLPNNKVECSSCHDVHDKKAVAGTHLLRQVNTTSQLCLTCHNK